MDHVAFGNTGLLVSRLSFGTGSYGIRGHSEQTALGVEGLARLLLTAYDRGINFWDAADDYGSHPHVARALQSTPRDKVVVATKTLSRHAAGVRRDIERYLGELNTDALDIVLLHCMTQPDWLERFADAVEALLQAKEQGKVRAVGVSCHGLAALRAAASAAWTDVILVRINSAGVNMDGAPEKVTPLVEKMYAAGKGVYGMKALGCGQLAGDARAAFEYVLRLGTIHAVTVGMSQEKQLKDNLGLFAELLPHFPLKAR